MKRLVVLLIFATASIAHGEIYTWTDSRGTANYANRLDDIPPRYRSKAKPLNYGDDVRKAAPTGQPASQPQPAAPAVPAAPAAGASQPQPPVPGPEGVQQERKLQRGTVKPKARRTPGEREE